VNNNYRLTTVTLQGASGTRLRRLSLSGSPQRGEIIFQNLILQSKRNFAKKLKNNFF